MRAFGPSSRCRCTLAMSITAPIIALDCAGVPSKSFFGIFASSSWKSTCPSSLASISFQNSLL